MSSPGGERQPYGYSGDATQRASAVGGGAGVDANGATDAMPAVAAAGRSPRRRRGLRIALIGTGAAIVLTGAYALGQFHGPDRANASGPGPTETPTPSIMPTATPGGSQDHELQPGQCVDLTASGNQVIIVQGDTTINGTSIFDNDARTAAEAKLVNGDYNICAPFGADVQETNTSQADGILGADTEQALDTGKFRSVVVFKFDGGQMVQGSSN